MLRVRPSRRVTRPPFFQRAGHTRRRNGANGGGKLGRSTFRETRRREGVVVKYENSKDWNQSSRLDLIGTCVEGTFFGGGFSIYVNPDSPGSKHGDSRQAQLSEWPDRVHNQ